MSDGPGATRVRRAVRDALGRDELARLHRTNRALDGLAIIAPPLLLVGFVWGVTVLPLNGWWVLCFFGVPWTLLLMALVSHDLFLHRRLGGDRLAWLAGVLFTVPRFSSYTPYVRAHTRHHRAIGTEDDGEAYKQDLQTVPRRLLFSTLPGILMVRAGRWADESEAARRREVRRADLLDPQYAFRIRVEKRIQRAWLLALIVLGALWPRPILLGFLLPTLTVGPVLNTVRVVLEHADLDPDNAYDLATFYRTGPITRVLFLIWNDLSSHYVLSHLLRMV